MKLRKAVNETRSAEPSFSISKSGVFQFNISASRDLNNNDGNNADVRYITPKYNPDVGYIMSKNDRNVSSYTIEDIINSKQKSGTYMHRLLALKFAAWLDTKFELWIIKTVDYAVFGNYKKHWEAHAAQEDAKKAMIIYRQKLEDEPTPEDVKGYFEAVDTVNAMRRVKTRAIISQYKLF